MSLSVRTLSIMATFATVLAGAGCGTSSNQGTAPPASHAPGGSSVGPPATTSGGKPRIAVTACSLLTSSQVTALLGAPAAQAGTERDLDANYKTCNWTTGSAAGNASTVQLGVLVKASPSDKGFGPSTNAGPAAPVSGVGDNATFASTGGASGQFGESILVANKGLASVSLDVSYGGSPHPASTQAAFAEDVRQVLSQLGQ